MTTTATPTQIPPTPKRAPSQGQPTWEIARLYPAQGHWSESDYLTLNSENHCVEYVDGFVEFLPMPTMLHQLIVGFLYRRLHQYVEARRLGVVILSGLRVRLEPAGSKQYRVPDLVFMHHDHADRMGNAFWEGADLAIEVVSEDDPRRDIQAKRHDYAAGGIGEYWIVNPLNPDNPEITVWTLKGEQYDVHGVFGPGKTATSPLLEGFSVDVSKVITSGNQ